MRVALSLLAALVLGALPAATHAQPSPAVDAAAVDRLFATWSSHETPGCALSVARGGQTVLTRTWGMADLEHDVAITPATVFEAGSVSKQFTASAVVLLAQEGKLSLDDDVRKHIPELPDLGTPVTLRRMLNHTSGLRDWGTVAAAGGWPRGTRVHTQAHVLDIMKRQKALNFAPGAEYLYSNSNYNLLAMVVERTSGMSFADFTRKRLFEPVGMTSTQWRDDYTRIVKGRAVAYSPVRPSGYQTNMPFENVHGNGGLLTTVSDLLLWNENLETGRVGGRALIEELQRRGRLNSGVEIEYAGGLFVSAYKGVPSVSHGGATAGYRAFLARYPGPRLSLALLCNAANVDAERLGNQVAELFLGSAIKPDTPPVAAAVDPAALKARAGLYRNTRTKEPMRLVLDEGALRVERGPRLVPSSDSAFAVTGGPGRLEFEGGGRARLLARSPAADPVAFEPVEEWAPTAAQLADYVGSYESDEAEVVYTVAVQDGKLVVRMRPDSSNALTPSYPDAFTSNVGLVRFLRSGEGRVEGLSLFLGRVRDLRFRRVAR